MSVPSSLSQPPTVATGPAQPGPLSPADLAASCRLPLVVLFLGAAVWLLIASAFGLIASIKFHAPRFLADPAWLTYGRVRPAASDAMLYGFCIPAGLGVALWMLTRLGRTRLAAPWLVAVGAVLWNVGVMLGIAGVLTGGNTGFMNLEFPGYAASLIFASYLMIAFWSLVSFHRRRERQVYASQWFLFAALFWFPWIYSAANLLLLGFQVRGMTQAVIAWWYSENLLVVWLGLVGLAAVFYFVPKLTGRDLYSRYLALFVLWLLMLFGSWGGIPASASVPAWMPVSSMLAAASLIVAYVAVAMNMHRTLDGKWSRLLADPSLRFIGFGLAAYLAAGLARSIAALPGIAQTIQSTWFAVADGFLHSYGFFAMVLFGAIYSIAPSLLGREFPFPRLIRAHFWLAAVGVLLFVVPLAAGGIVQGLKLQNPDIAFADITKGMLPFLRASTTGDLLVAVGHLLFLINLGGLALAFYRARAISDWKAVTAEVGLEEVRA